MTTEEANKWSAAFTSPEWVWRFFMILGGAAMLYLQSRYVTRAEYIADRKEFTETLSGIGRGMSGIQTSLELLRQNANQLLDHETRIRVIEHERK